MSSLGLDWRFPGDVIEVDCEIEGEGGRWVRLAELYDKGQSGWMMIDGTKAGFGKLLEPMIDIGDAVKAEDEEDDQDDGVVEEWGAVYDSAYAAANAVTEDPALNYSGYADSFNPGDVHVPHTVDEWADFTVKRVEQLSPTRVLELGCGNGMILLRCLIKDTWSQME